MVTDEIKGVLGVNVPLVLPHFPVSAALGDIGFSHQGVFRHFPSAPIHREGRTWIRAKLPHLVDDDPIVVQHDDIVSVEPCHLAFDVRRLIQFRRGQRVHNHEHVIRFDHPFQQLGIGGLGRAVVPRFHVVPFEVDGNRRRIVQLDGFVVAVALDVFRNEDFLAEARALAIQNFHFQKRVAQAVAFDTQDAIQRTARFECGRLKSAESAAPPDLVSSDAELCKVVLRESHRVEDDLRLIGDDKNVLGVHRLGCVPKGDRCVFHAQTPQG